MREFELTASGVMVRGTVVDTFVSAFGPYKNRSLRILGRYFGTEEIGTGEDDLYPLRDYLRAMEEIQTQFGPEFMQRVGSFIFEKAVFPPGIDSLVSAMGVIDVAYNMNHTEAAGKIGGYHWTQTGERRGEMRVDGPYPCAFDQGILATIASRFEAGAKVEHAANGACRHDGGPECVYIVTW